MHNVFRQPGPKFVGQNFYKNAILERFNLDLKQSDGSPANPREVASIVRFVMHGGGEQKDRINSVLLAQSMVGGIFSLADRGKGKVLWFKVRDARPTIFGTSYKPHADDIASPLRFFQAYVKWENLLHPSFVNMAGLRKVESVATPAQKKKSKKSTPVFSTPTSVLATV